MKPPIALSKDDSKSAKKDVDQGVPEWAKDFDKLIKDRIGSLVFSVSDDER